MPSKVWLKLALIVLVAGAVIGLLAFGFTRDARYIHSPLIASTAPGFALTLFDGKAITLEDFRGKAVLLNFWASWCVPCRAEAQALETAWQRYKDGAVVFVGVNIQDKEEDARAFMKEFGITYLNGPDDIGKIAIDYGVWGIPEIFFIDAQGRITHKHAGELRLPVITAKLDEAIKSVVSAEGMGEYRPIR